MSNLRAQTATEGIVRDLERAKAYTKEYLDTMPENDHSSKTTKRDTFFFRSGFTLERCYI